MYYPKIITGEHTEIVEVPKEFNGKEIFRGSTQYITANDLKNLISANSEVAPQSCTLLVVLERTTKTLNNVVCVTVGFSGKYLVIREKFSAVAGWQYSPHTIQTGSSKLWLQINKYSGVAGHITRIVMV